MLSEATSEPEEYLKKIINQGLAEPGDDATSSSLQDSDIFSENPGSGIEALALHPPISDEDYMFHMTTEEGIDDLFLDQFIN